MSTLPLRRTLLAAAALGVLLGCQAETFGADDVRIDPQDVTVVGGGTIAGGTLTLQTPEFAALGEGPVIGTIGGVVAGLVMRSPGSDTIRLSVPDTAPGGPAAVTLRLPGGREVPLGNIQISGFGPTRYLQGQTRGTSQVLPYLPGIVSTDGSGWVVVDARRGTARSIPTNEQYYGVGSTLTANSFLADDGTGWRRVTLSLGRVSADSSYLGWSGIPVSHELAPGVVLQAVKGGYSNLNWNDLDGYGYPDHVAYSGNGRWAVPDHWNSDSGVLVWDRTLASYNWIPRWRRARTAFLPDDQLVVVGAREGEPYDYTQPLWLARIDPQTRSVLDSTLLSPEIRGYISVGTTTRGWIIIAWPEADSWYVSIRDPLTLGEIGRSSVALSTDQDPAQDLLIVDDPTYQRWYLIPEYQNRGTIAIATFLTP